MSVSVTSQQELDALISLLDDNDTEVVDIVEKKLKSLGKEYISALENSLHECHNFIVQTKIEEIIVDINSIDLKEALQTWIANDSGLLEAAYVISRFENNTQIEIKHFNLKVERITRSIWLEMTNYLTPLERIKVIENILYKVYNLKGSKSNYTKVDNFLITDVIEKLSGNGITNSILYIILAQMLDLPVRGFKYNDTIILAWYSHEFLFDYEHNQKTNNFNNIKIFIDPLSGKGFSHLDMQYLLTVNETGFNDNIFKPLNNKEIIEILLIEYSKCFTQHFHHKYTTLNRIISELFY